MLKIFYKSINFCLFLFPLLFLSLTKSKWDSQGDSILARFSAVGINCNSYFQQPISHNSVMPSYASLFMFCSYLGQTKGSVSKLCN